MQNKYKKHLIVTGVFLLLLLQNLSAQSIKKGTESNNVEKGKTLITGDLVKLLSSQTSAVQSNAGGDAHSNSYNLTATSGQPGPVGITSSTSFNNSSGFIPSLASIDVQAPAAPISITAGGSNPSPWQNTSNFDISWTNPQDPSGIVKAYFKLGSAPPIANFDTSGSISGTPPGVINATAESGQDLYLWLEDGRGNVDFSNNSNVVLNYDQSQPITIANSPDTSITESFTVVWSGATDPGGSGLTGFFNVKIKDGSGSWVDWKTNFNGTSDIYAGTQGHTYYFEAAGIDNAGNTEQFTGLAEDTTVVDTFAVDNQAPEEPIDLTAAGTNPSPWQNATTFDINWTNPPDMSGIDRAYYKLGTVPTTNYDTTGSISGTPPGDVISDIEGGQDLFMWLVDGRGNVNYDNYSIVEMRYDITPPTGTMAESPDTSATEIFTVEWSGADDAGGSGLSGTYDVKVKEGAGAWSDWKVNFEGLSDDYTGTHGQTYYFEAAARDSAGNIEAFAGLPEATTVVDTSIIDIIAPLAPINLTAGGSAPSPWQNSNIFEIVWTNPSDISGIVSAYYKLNSAPTSNDDTTGSLSGQSPQNVIATIQGGQSLYIWLVDGSGNTDFNNNSNVILNLDQTNPSGSVASSIVTSNAITFTVSWIGGSDLGGSGLTGNYDVNVKDGVNNWSTWKQNFNGTSDSFSGADGHTYYFEAAARDIAGNIETFIGIPECSTAVDTSGDNTAPLAPVSLVSSPSDWTNVNNFSVIWDNPEPDANIDGTWHKVGTAPVNDDDGFFDANDITDITGITVDNAGEFTVYVWLQDKAGNHSYLNAATTVVRFDSIAPSITSNLSSNYNVGTPIVISPTIMDSHSGVNISNLYYRKTGESTTIGPVLFVNGSATVPIEYNTQQGIEYAIAVTDNANNVGRFPTMGYNSIQINLIGDGGMQLDNTGQPVARHSGSSVDSYRVFSVPFILDNKTPSAVLEDDLGTYDNTTWRFFDVQNTTIREYPDIRNSSIINPGKGFLMLVNMSGKIIDSGPGRTPIISNYTQIPLNVGWNLIGNPFDFDIPFANLSVNGSQPDAQYHGSSGWTTAGDLRKWEGLAVYSDSSRTLSIVPQSGPLSKYKISDRFVDDNWGIKISAISEKSIDLDNYIGVYSEFDETQRNFWHEPPRLPNGISLNTKPIITELNKGEVNDNSTLSSYIQPVSDDGNYWDFEIVSDHAGEDIRLELEYFADIPEEFNKYLINFNYNIVHELTDDLENINFKTNSRKKCEFRIIIGNENYVESNSEGLELIPTKFELRQNFPNPFNPNTNMIFSLPQDEKVTLEVFNLLGQKVKTIVSQKLFTKGYHTIEWDGRNGMGENVASGMYVFRLISGKQVNMKKGILIR
jgi:flagellar hook capping protein FlgD